MTEPASIPWRVVAKSLNQSPKKVARLMRENKIGFLEGRPRTLLPEHIEQLIRCVEVAPDVARTEDLELLGLSPRSLAHHRRRTA